MPGPESAHAIHNSPMDVMDATTLSRWTRFALKGGIGHCTATTDYLAENANDLMFLAGDEITVLMQLEESPTSGEDSQADWYLGYCEGVVGRFHGKHVQFHAKLKKPVMAKRQSARNTTSLSPQPITSHSPAPTLVALSPPSTASSISPLATPTLATFLTQRPTPSESEDSPILPISPSPNLQHGPERSPSLTRSVKSPAPSPPTFISETEQGADLNRRPSQSTVSSRYSLASRSSSSLSSPLHIQRALEDNTLQDEEDGSFDIGFALMQGDESDDDDDENESRHNTSTPIPSPSPSPSPIPEANQTALPKETDTHAAVSESPTSSSPPPPPEPPFFHSSSPSRDSLKPSIHSTSEWESDMDIYDDYRYSRYSVASRMSRFSQMSTATKATGSGMADPQPPVPRRPSLDSLPSFESTRPMPNRNDSQSSSVDGQPVPSISSLNLRSTPPAPLDLSRKSDKVLGTTMAGGQAQPSPLLHTNWGSPESSPEASSFRSPGSSRFVFGYDDDNGGGIASALRRRLEGERSPGPIHKERDSLYLGRGIVVEDDEGLKEVSPTSSEPQLPNIQVDDEDGPQPDVGRTTPPPSPLSAQPPPSPFSTPSSFARPTLSDLRATVDPVTRTSIFLPHPNAPRPNLSATSQGPKYVQPEMRAPVHSGTGGGTLIDVIIQALTTPPLDRFKGPTIYGRLKEDLSVSMGPVGVWFTLTPVLATAPHTITKTVNPPIAAPMPRRAATASMIPSAMPEEEEPEPASDPKSQGEPLPRANFFPQKAPRPRSRSFSGFDSGSSMPIPKPRSEEPTPPPPSTTPARSSSLQATATPSVSSSSPATSSSPAASSSAAPSSPAARTGHRNKGPQPKVVHAPSPLSLPQNNSVVSPPASAVQQLRHVASSSVLEERRSSSSFRKTSNASSHTHTHLRHLSNLSRNSASASPTPSSIQESIETRSLGTASPSPSVSVTRNTSLRTKLSLPNLRRKGSAESENVATTMQVDDMDFELVRPQIPVIRSPRTSKDSKSSIMGRDSLTESLLRTDSPSLSIAPRSPATTVSSSSPFQGSSWPLVALSAEDMEAHRVRELRWMSLMSSVTPPQSRKSKKVKKLVYEGVPSSVRSLVWGLLTDGKAKEVPDVYRRLVARGKDSGRGAPVENDIKGPLGDYTFITDSIEAQTVELLRSYLTMVPDVSYCSGITLVAATMLTVVPEEDAFWTFVSVVDTHLRTYYTPQSMQMEVDAELFSRTVEASDPQVFKKIYVDLHINPIDVCAPWFESVFANSLPLELLHRVWDLFLFEGVPFLFRVGIGLISCCRRQIIEVPAQAQDATEKVLRYLHRPPASWLPPSVDGFMTLPSISKVKEEDVKKMREKMIGQLQARKTRARAMSPKPPRR